MISSGYKKFKVTCLVTRDSCQNLFSFSNIWKFGIDWHLPKLSSSYFCLDIYDSLSLSTQFPIHSLHAWHIGKLHSVMTCFTDSKVLPVIEKFSISLTFTTQIFPYFPWHRKFLGKFNLKSSWTVKNYLYYFSFAISITRKIVEIVLLENEFFRLYFTLNLQWIKLFTYMTWRVISCQFDHFSFLTPNTMIAALCLE